MPLPLLRSPLQIAHDFWRQIIAPEDTVIDATCGNGKDTCELAQLVSIGKVLAFDIQRQAIENTRKLLQTYGLEKRVEFFHLSHEFFPSTISPSSVRLIAYNLGYLPGGDKTVTTVTEATIRSVKQALDLVMPGGLISITLYPGHAEGAIEKEHLLEFANTLSSAQWAVCHLEWINRQKSPSLLLLEKLGSGGNPPRPDSIK